MNVMAVPVFFNVQYLSRQLLCLYTGVTHPGSSTLDMNLRSLELLPDLHYHCTTDILSELLFTLTHDYPAPKAADSLVLVEAFYSLQRFRTGCHLQMCWVVILSVSRGEISTVVIEVGIFQLIRYKIGDIYAQHFRVISVCAMWIVNRYSIVRC
jgi:hypothetical protein